MSAGQRAAAREDRTTASEGSEAPVGRRAPRWWPVTEHWLRRYRRLFLGTAISSFLVPLLYLAGMGLGLGALVDRGSGGIGGVPYVAFVAPGVLAATALQVAAGETTFSVMGSIKWDRTYHGMLATPLRVPDVVLGHLAFVLVRVVLACAVFLAVAAALGTVRSWWGVLALPVAVLGGMSFATVIYAYSARLTSDRGLVLLFRFVVLPLSLFSGTFFPVEQLPAWLQPLAWATPLAHVVQACRDLVLGTATLAGVLAHLLVPTLWLAVGWVLAVRMLHRRMVD